MSQPAPCTNVGRRLEILSALLRHEARTGEGLGVIAVAETVGREKSQISRGLRHLNEAGLAERDQSTLEFAAGGRLLRLAARAGEGTLVDGARPVLEQLAATTGERAHLTVLCAGAVLTIDTVAPSATVQSVGWVGQSFPLHCTASGAALLANHEAGAVRALVGPDPLPTAGPAAPRTLDELMAALERVRASRLAVADGQFREDLVAVAAPVGGSANEVVAAVNVSGPAFRMRPQVGVASAAVRVAAARLTEGTTPA